MAAWTKADLANRVLEHLGVKPAGNPASAEDVNRTVEVIDAVHAELRGEGVAPFDLSAIPAWAQLPMRDIVAGDLLGLFGVGGESLQKYAVGAARGRARLMKQVAGKPQDAPIRPRWY